jgi:hypothetical protein
MECTARRALSGGGAAIRAALAALCVLSAAFAGGETPPKRAVKLPAPIPVAALDRMPEDATAYCGDGTWSSVVKKESSCKANGGVAVWFGPAPAGTTGRCRDGTYTRVKRGTYGACSGNGGVKIWLSHPVPVGSPTDS